MAFELFETFDEAEDFYKRGKGSLRVQPIYWAYPREVDAEQIEAIKEDIVRYSEI